MVVACVLSALELIFKNRGTCNQNIALWEKLINGASGTLLEGTLALPPGSSFHVQ